MANVLQKNWQDLIKPSKPDEIWSNGARQFFLATALYFYGRSEAPTLSGIKALVESPGGFRRWCTEFLKDREASQRHHPECLAGFTRLATGPADTVGGMLENLRAHGDGSLYIVYKSPRCAPLLDGCGFLKRHAHAPGAPHIEIWQGIVVNARVAAEKAA